MCSTCDSKAAGRRGFLKLGAASLAGAVFATAMRPARARAAEGVPTSLSPEEALAELKSGNERYVSQPEVCALDLSEERMAVAGHQAPFATIIACADSRSPPIVLKNSQNDRSRKSRFRVPSLRCAGNRQDEAHTKAIHGKIAPRAEPLPNFNSRPPTSP